MTYEEIRESFKRVLTKKSGVKIGEIEFRILFVLYMLHIPNDREHLYEALDYVAKGKVRVMTEMFPLEEISNAYDKVANGNVV